MKGNLIKEEVFKGGFTMSLAGIIFTILISLCYFQVGESIIVTAILAVIGIGVSMISNFYSFSKISIYENKIIESYSLFGKVTIKEVLMDDISHFDKSSSSRSPTVELKLKNGKIKSLLLGIEVSYEVYQKAFLDFGIPNKIVNRHSRPHLKVNE